MTTLADAIRDLLLTAEPAAKVRAARHLARAWRGGRLIHAFDETMPDTPARPDRPALLPPNRMPRRGKGGSERGRIALLHALAHIEYTAIDLAFDMAAGSAPASRAHSSTTGLRSVPTRRCTSPCSIAG